MRVPRIRGAGIGTVGLPSYSFGSRRSALAANARVECGRHPRRDMRAPLLQHFAIHGPSIATALVIGLLGGPTWASSDATPNGSQFQVNTYTTAVQETSSVASDSNGNFVVAWR